MGLSGQSAALLLSQLGAKVTVSDSRADISYNYDPAAHGIKCRLGQDPSDFVDEFDLVIISPGISVNAPFVQKAKSLGITVWGETELAFRLCPCPMLAITGTNGKTTVTTLVGEILKRHNPGTVIAGNIGIPLTGLVSSLTPENIVVAEISSFQLETIAAFRPKISAVLNMTEDHLDRHGTMENYIAAKSRIFENQRQDDITVLNYDNPVTREMKPSGRVLFFSLHENPECGVYLKDGIIKYRLSAAAKHMHGSRPGESGEDAPILSISETRVMPENALAAVALSLCAGVAPEIIADVLRDFKGVEHRLEYTATINGVDYYNDSKATNVDAAIKALENFKRPVILIGGGSDKNADFAPWVKLFGKKVVRLIVLGQTAGQIVAACTAAGFSAYEKANSLKEAVDRAKALAEPGQVVLFSPACASFDMFRNYIERGDLFKQYVQGGA